MVGEVRSELQLLRKSKQWEEKWRAIGFTPSWRETGARKTPSSSVASLGSGMDGGWLIIVTKWGNNLPISQRAEPRVSSLVEAL